MLTAFGCINPLKQIKEKKKQWHDVSFRVYSCQEIDPLKIRVTKCVISVPSNNHMLSKQKSEDYK